MQQFIQNVLPPNIPDWTTFYNELRRGGTYLTHSQERIEYQHIDSDMVAAKRQNPAMIVRPLRYQFDPLYIKGMVLQELEERLAEVDKLGLKFGCMDIQNDLVEHSSNPTRPLMLIKALNSLIDILPDEKQREEERAANGDETKAGRRDDCDGLQHEYFTVPA